MGQRQISSLRVFLRFLERLCLWILRLCLSNSYGFFVNQMRRFREADLKMQMVKKMVEANRTQRLKVLMLPNMKELFVVISNYLRENTLVQIKI